MKKVKLFLSEDEWRLVIHCLNKKRNNLIAEGKYTDTVDSALLKVIDAPTKKVKVS